MASSRTYPKLYLVGDSNIELAFTKGGFANQLANEYIRRLDVVNRGFGGYNSEHLRAIIPQLLHNDNTSNSPIHTATVLLGSNDASVPSDPWHVTPSRHKENLETIVKCLRDNGVQRIVLLSPPPMDDERWNKLCEEQWGLPGSDNKLVGTYADVCSNLAKELDLPHVDLYGELMKQESWRDLFNDGAHFNEKGHIIVYEILKKVLGPLVSDLPFVYPEWEKISDGGIEVLN